MLQYCLLLLNRDISKGQWGHSESGVILFHCYEGDGAYSFTLIRPSLLFLSPQLLLHFLMPGFETFNTVPTCMEPVHLGNRILIQTFIA